MRDLRRLLKRERVRERGKGMFVLSRQRLTRNSICKRAFSMVGTSDYTQATTTTITFRILWIRKGEGQETMRIRAEKTFDGEGVFFLLVASTQLPFQRGQRFFYESFGPSFSNFVLFSRTFLSRPIRVSSILLSIHSLNAFGDFGKWIVRFLRKIRYCSFSLRKF